MACAAAYGECGDHLAGAYQHADLISSVQVWTTSKRLKRSKRRALAAGGAK